MSFYRGKYKEGRRWGSGILSSSLFQTKRGKWVRKKQYFPATGFDTVGNKRLLARLRYHL